MLIEESGNTNWTIVPHNGVRKATSGGADVTQVKLSYDGQHAGKWYDWSTIALVAAWGILTDRAGHVGANAAALQLGGSAVSIFTIEKVDPVAQFRLVARGGDMGAEKIC